MTANGNDFLKGFLLCKILLRINSRLNLVFGPSRTSHESISRRATYYDLCSKRNHSRVANYTCLALTYLSKASESHESMRDLSFFPPQQSSLKVGSMQQLFYTLNTTLYSSIFKRKIHLEVRIQVLSFVLNNKPFYILLHWNSA